MMCLSARFGIVTVSVAGLMLACMHAWSADQWPKVEDVHEHYAFADVDSAGFDVVVKEHDGAHRPLYRLKCHSGLYEADRDFDYSGLLDCRLVSLYSKETVSSLLTETSQQTSDWHDRGRFLASHLRTGCASYPEWGQRRSFLLRGMDITIAISDVVFGSSAENQVKSYAVQVTVINDPNAHTALAQKPKVPEPPWFYGVAKSCGRTEGG